MTDTARHYDIPIDENNDPVHDPKTLREYMDRWDGSQFIDKMQLNQSKMVLDAGCAACRQQFESAKEAVKNMGLSIEVEYITDLAKVMEYGVMSMPALVVNEKVVAMGKVLKAADVEKLLHKYC